MDRNDMSKLKFDRRLQDRRGWLAPGELDAELEALPDVSHKVADADDSAGESDSAAPAAPAAGPTGFGAGESS